ncbi:hypothetical protein RSAG8_09187, partial [Rhizoctonia solani AG-8 WAC10335]
MLSCLFPQVGTHLLTWTETSFVRGFTLTRARPQSTYSWRPDYCSSWSIPTGRSSLALYDNIVYPLFWASSDSPRPSLEKTGSPVEGSGSGSPLSRALNLLNRRSSPGRKSPPPTGDSSLRALSILQSILALHLPGNSDPDDSAIRNASKAKGVSLDEFASPVAALLTRLVGGDESARARVAAVVLPPDMDRSSALEKRDDFLGRCIRLMTSVYYPTLKDTIGEMLFVLCGSDGQALSAAIGYGNAAGYLYNKGIMAPPPASSGGDDVNPITGTRETPSGPSLSEMTDEEKQREAEKLFVLFDRMERMGMAKNPIREAFQSGKFENLEKKDDDSD